jgi:NAD(P)-dependent dehydrogenase (short-subunit alcohol dehydrogenase family)
VKIKKHKMKESISGKKILITGATDGLGKLVAKHLVEMGAVVLLHGRNPEKGKALVVELSKVGKVEYYNADYSSLKEVKNMSQVILKELSQIDILINNVGIGKGKFPVREMSRDGFELRLAVNYLSHVLLTENLLPLLPENTGAVINVASIGQEPIDFSNLMLEKGYEGFFAYKRSKTALIMYTIELANRLKSKGIKINAIHPASLMNTKMVTEEWDYTLTTVEEGAEAVENLLFTKTTGEYFDGKRLSRAIAQVYDQSAREKLMEITMDLLKDFIQE